MFTKVIITASILATANGHMVLRHPARFMGPELHYGYSPYNSPLNTHYETPSDYPCKVSTKYDTYLGAPPRTILPPGSQQVVNFTGQATHGGGSCQLSLSKDLKPDAMSQFKVIHSIQGGCPAEVKGNMGWNSKALDPFEYHYTVPSDLPPGDYTFAWTWFNRIGDREMYMNCAPVTIPAGGSKVKREDAEGAWNALPNMFIANVPDVQCATPENIAIKYPDPGTSVQNISEQLIAPTGPISECYAPLQKDLSGASKKWPGYGPQGNTTAPSSGSGTVGGSSSSAPAASTSAASTPASSYAATSTPAATTAPSSTPPYPGGNKTQTYAPSGGPSGAPVPYSGGSGKCQSGYVSCPTPGAVMCIGKSQFGLCGLDNCAIPQPLAMGTVCQRGQITKREVPITFKDRKNGMLRRDARWFIA